MAAHNPGLYRPLELSCAQHREDEQAPFCSSNRNGNSSIIGDIISNINNINCDDERDAGKDAGIIFSSNNSSSSRVNIDSSSSSSSSSINDNSGSSGSNDGNSPTVQHVIGADPWCFGGNGQALCGGNNGEGGSLASGNGGIRGEGVEGGGEEENCAGGDVGGCPSTDTSYEAVDAWLGFTAERSARIDMGENFGRGMDIVIGKKSDDVSDELVATVGSTVALLSDAQATVKENIASMERQGLFLIEAEAAIRTLAARLSASEAEKDRLEFAKDELSATLAVLEEEGEAARTNNKDDSRKILELTQRADRAEDAAFHGVKENADLVATVAEEQRKNRELCAEVALLKANSKDHSKQIVELARRAECSEAASTHFGRENEVLAATLAEEQHKNHDMCAELSLLKATLARRSDAEVSSFADGCKATSASVFNTGSDEAITVAAGTPRSAGRRPLAAVDPNSERKCGKGGKSPPTLAYQTTLRDCQGQRTTVVEPVVFSTTGSLRCKAEVSPSMVGSAQSMVSVNRSSSFTTASRKVDSPAKNTISASRDYRNDATSPKVEIPVQQTAPTTRRFSARIAAKAGRDAAPPPRRFSARIAAKANRDITATGAEGVTTRGAKRVKDGSPLSSLRVTRSAFRAAEQAAAAADKRLTAEPKVKDRKRFMRF